MSECVEFALRRCGLRHSLTLKPEQLKSVEVVLAGSHVIAVLPTGFGKSLIYQLLPFAFDLQTDSSSSCVLLVSPLVALMVQQVERARSSFPKSGILFRVLFIWRNKSIYQYYAYPGHGHACTHVKLQARSCSSDHALCPLALGQGRSLPRSTCAKRNRDSR